MPWNQNNQEVDHVDRNQSWDNEALVCKFGVYEWQYERYDLRKSSWKGEWRYKASQVKNLRVKLLAQIGDGGHKKVKMLEEFHWGTTSVEFSRTLFIWHIATDLYFYDDKRLHLKQMMYNFLSNYMLYLVIMKPNIHPKGTSDSWSSYRDASEEIFSIKQRNSLMIL